MFSALEKTLLKELVRKRLRDATGTAADALFQNILDKLSGTAARPAPRPTTAPPCYHQPPRRSLYILQQTPQEPPYIARADDDQEEPAEDFNTALSSMKDEIKRRLKK